MSPLITVCVSTPLCVSAQFEIARDLDPTNQALHGACYDCRTRLQLMPLGSIPEVGKAYLRPPTPILRTTYGAGTVYTWGGGDGGCLGHADTDTIVAPKCVDVFRGRQVRDLAMAVCVCVCVRACVCVCERAR